MSVTEKSAIEKEFRGYWERPFIRMMRGDPSLTSEQIKVCAEILYNHRCKGNPLTDKSLENTEARDLAIIELDAEYRRLKGETDLVKRSALLTTVFMRLLAQKDTCTLTDPQRKYVKETSLPSALKVANSLDLLKVDPIAAWLVDYRLGCSTEKAIRPHTDLYLGMTDAQKTEFTTMRGNTAKIWYEAYGQNLVKKSDLEILLEKLKKGAAHSLSDAPVLENTYMQAAFQGYHDLAAKFPADKTELYWEGVIVALETFIERAN